MPTIPFPSVPLVAGVPTVVRSATSTISNPTLSLISGAIWQAVQTESQWGIFDSNGNALVDTGLSGASGIILSSIGMQPILSTVGVQYGKETRVSDFPIEQGSFATYNKVELPAEPTVTLSFDGTEDKRANFLNVLDAACKSTGLYSVVTPEVKYINYTITRYSYQRYASHGATLLIVDIALKEVRQVTPKFTSTQNAKSDNAKPSSNNGIVQPVAASGSF
jgi:hypothetical protein